ncbi:MAG: beta-lactamase family protein, partial [Gemmatimonadetes bacterium]|nr:beta-lactamase family protein [Gemmatimonadota bacterium]
MRSRLASACRRAPTFLAVLAAATALDPAAASAIQDVDPAAVDAVFADIDADVPGCAVGVYDAGEVLYANGYGLANADYGLPITPQSVFYLGSVGKQFTAAAVLHAVQAGHISLDDPVQKWITEMPDYDAPVTVRHLVHHTSGVRDYLTLMSLAAIAIETPMSDAAVTELIARQEGLNFTPGDRYLYSNSGYFLLAEIVERATGSTLRQYLEEHFLGPLGMESTRVNDDRREPMPNRVVGYRVVDGELRMDHPWTFDKVGSGGVYSSIEDMARWDRNWFTEEVGGAGFSEALLQRGVLNDGTELPYAFGLGVREYRGAPIVEHGGSLMAFRSQLLRFPEHEITTMVACSFPTADAGARARRVADAVLGDRLEPVVADDAAAAPTGAAMDLPDAPPPSLTDEQLDRFVGAWRASMGIEIAIEREGSNLFFLQGPQRAPLRIVAEDRVALPMAQIDMRFSDLRDGRYHHQDVTQGPSSFTAERIGAGDEADWSQYTGTYYSSELDVTWEIVVTDDGALARAAAGPERT